MDDESFSRYQRRVQELVRHGHRGSATEDERRAAQYLAEELQRLGLAPEEERFTGSRSLGARLLAHVAVAAVIHGRSAAAGPPTSSPT
jgi:acetylornithine deacetylase/succinyl-diaminopimelate desuccinylase-like protein